MSGPNDNMSLFHITISIHYMYVLEDFSRFYSVSVDLSFLPSAVGAQMWASILGVSG